MAHLATLYASRYGMVPNEVAFDSDSEAESFIGKKARARREDRRDKKEDFKLERIRTRAEGRGLVASQGGGLAGLGKGLGDIAGKIFDGGDAGAGAGAGSPSDAAPLPAAEKSNKGLIIGGILLGVVVVVVIVVMAKKKKESK